MTQDAPRPAETRRRHLGLIIGAIVGVAFLGIIASGFELPDSEESGVAVAELSPGDCFTYPGDGVIPVRVDTVPCSDVHYGEVYGTTTAGDDESCVGLFEAYTGVSNYWETDYIIGFLNFDDSRMHCYAYAAEDFIGTLRA